MHALMVKVAGRYRPAAKDEILSVAVQYAVQDAPRALAQSPAAVIRLARPFMAAREREAFYVMWLDGRHALIAIDELFQGTVDASPVFPREVAKRALERNAVAAIFIHNHPSGNLQPSPGDESITRRMKETLGLLDISVLDHFIVSATGHYSMAEHGLI